jgi:hypothetical protein
MKTIIRPSTPEERDLTKINSDGESTGFINLYEEKPDKLILIRINIGQKIRKRNRHILINSENPLDAIKKLCCFDCFNAEHRKNLTSDDFKENFEKYTGRYEFKEIAYKKLKHRYGENFDISVTLRLKPCVYCGCRHSYTFDKIDLKPEVFKKLQEQALKEEGVEW